MKVLPSVPASKEQLPLVLNDLAGVAVIRGAAGSGKTTTALLRLRQLTGVRLHRRERLGLMEPVRVLVVTYNKSLSGYIQRLAEEQITSSVHLELEVSTFAKWARGFFPTYTLQVDDRRETRLIGLGSQLGFDSRFLLGEVDYALGRFHPDEMSKYATTQRDGRGTVPRVNRQAVLEQVLLPYLQWKQESGAKDWHDLAVDVLSASSMEYDLIIVDEAQDFTANQLRSLIHHAAASASVTFVLDTMQRIYPSFFTWRELGLDASKFVLNDRLRQNRRNTRQIAAFARPLVSDLTVDENGELPDFSAALADGARPQMHGGTYSSQLDQMVKYIKAVDTTRENVGILHPKGHGWFNATRARLRQERIDFVELAQNSFWPQGDINVGLSTLHSAKGLEFDHVMIAGVTARTAQAPADDEHTATQSMRRLMAMGAGRARVGLLVLHDPRELAPVLNYLDPATYDEI